MYQHRRLTPAQRAELAAERVGRGFQPHAPPHPFREERCYLLTAACYEHTPHLQASKRRDQLQAALFEQLIPRGVEVQAWAVVPNHYHLLVNTDEFAAVGAALRLVHGKLAHQWNAEDGASGRKVWFRYSDRAIRSQKHYYVALNYIHYNPVKHGQTGSPYDWPHSSVHEYLRTLGREGLRDLWTRYPVKDFGRGWDDA